MNTEKSRNQAAAVIKNSATARRISSDVVQETIQAAWRYIDARADVASARVNEYGARAAQIEWLRSDYAQLAVKAELNAERAGKDWAAASHWMTFAEKIAAINPPETLENFKFSQSLALDAIGGSA